MALKDKLNTTSIAAIAFLLCSIIQKIISFITMPFYTDLLTLDQYGQFSLYTTWYVILEVIDTAGLCNGVVNNAMIKYKNDKDGFISSVQTLCSITIIICFGIILLLWQLFKNIINLPINVIIVIFVQLFFYISFLLYTTKEKFFYRFKIIVAANILIAIASNLLSIIFIFNNPNNLNNGLYRIYINAAVYIIFGLIFYIYNLYKGKTLYKREYWIYSLKFSLPLVPYLFFAIMLDNIDSIFISNICDSSKLAIYSFNNQLALIPNFINASLYSVITPMIYRHLSENNIRSIKNIASITIMFMMIMVFGIVFIAPELIMFLGNINYLDGISLVLPLSLTVLIRFIFGFFITAEMYLDKTYIPSVITFIAFVVTFIMDYIFIPKIGYIAVGYIKLLVYFIMLILHYILLKDNREIINNNEMIVYLLFTLFASLIIDYLYNWQLLRFVIGIVYVVVLLIRIVYILKDSYSYEEK